MGRQKMVKHSKRFTSEQRVVDKIPKEYVETLASCPSWSIPEALNRPEAGETKILSKTVCLCRNSGSMKNPPAVYPGANPEDKCTCGKLPSHRSGGVKNSN